MYAEAQNTRSDEAIFKMAFEDGFSHGDSYPANLVLTPQGELALFDFGTVGFLSHAEEGEQRGLLG